MRSYQECTNPIPLLSELWILRIMSTSPIKFCKHNPIYQSTRYFFLCRDSKRGKTDTWWLLHPRDRNKLMHSHPHTYHGEQNKYLFTEVIVIVNRLSSWINNLINCLYHMRLSYKCFCISYFYNKR